MTFFSIKPDKFAGFLFFIFCFTASLAFSAPNRQLWVILGPHQDVLDGNNEMMAKYDSQIRGQVDLLLTNPRIKYAVGNTWNLVHFVRKNPGYLPRIKTLMERGSFSSNAGWTGFETAWFSGEYIQRNIFYSKKLLSSLFGYDSHWTQFNDVPSYTPQTPQILAKSNVNLMMLHNLRMHYALNNLPYLYMVGLDGTKVLTSTIAYDEFLEMLDFLPASSVKGAIKYSNIFGVSMIQAISDWGVEPDASRRVLTFVDKWNREYAKASGTNLFIKTPEDFADFAIKKISKNKISLKKATGMCQPWPWRNYGNAYSMGLFSKAENMLPVAEKLSSVCEILGLDAYPSKSIVGAWENLLCFSDHNATGSRLLQSYCIRAYETSAAIIDSKMSKLGEAVKFSQDGVPVLFFNSLNWDRSDIVLVDAVVGKDFSSVVDQRGRRVPSQVVKRDKNKLKILFKVDDVPSLGYKTYYLTKGKESKTKTSFQTWENHIENDYFSVDADDRIGVFRIYDKKNGRDLVNVKEGGDFFAPEIRMFHYRYILKKWGGVLKPIIKTVFTGCKVVESGPLRAVIRTTGFLDAYAVTMEWILYNGVDRLDINLSIKRPYNVAKSNSVMNFPLKLSNKNIRTGVAYGSIPTMHGEVNRLVPFSFSKRSPNSSFVSYPYGDEFKNFNVGIYTLGFQKWFAIEDGGACLVVAQKFYNSRFARNENGGTGLLVGMPLSGVLPKNNKDKLFHYSYSMSTARGSWKDAKSHRLGWEVNAPIVYKVCEKGTGKLAETDSFLKVEPSDNLVLTTFKKNFDKNGYTIRFFENMDEDVDAAVTVSKSMSIPAKEVSRSSMMEESQTVLSYSPGETLKVPVKGFGIETIGFFDRKMTDITPPGMIDDLSVKEVTSNSLKLTWTAPGDDGNDGQAEYYDVRYSQKAIVPLNWSDAKPYKDAKPPAKAGTKESMIFTDFKPATEYFIAVKTQDEKRNTSTISNVVKFATEMPDNVAPATTPDLRAKGVGSSAIRLDWTAPGDDKNSGKVSGYRVYVSSKPLKSSGDFKSAKYALYKNPDASAGQRDYFKVVSLKPKTEYHFYLVAFDEGGNSSPPSEVASAETNMLKVIRLKYCEDTTISGVNEEEMSEVFGREDIIRTWNVRNRAILMRFDLSKVPSGISVSKASLNLYNLDIVYAKRGKFSCYPLTRKWSASFANWKRADKGLPWKTRGGDIDFASSYGKNFGFVDEVIIGKKKAWVSLDITLLLKEWLSKKRKNYGVLLAGAPECEFVFCSSKYRDAGKRPFLEIKY